MHGQYKNVLLINLQTSMIHLSCKINMYYLLNSEGARRMVNHNTNTQKRSAYTIIVLDLTTSGNLNCNCKLIVFTFMLYILSCLITVH